MRVSWSRAIWWCSVAMAIGAVVGVGCGGRLIGYDCKPGWQFCKEAVVCCPEYTVCGTGQPNAQGLTCPLGSCCPQLDDAGDDGAPEAAWWESFDADYSGQGNLPGNGGGSAGGSKPPAPRRQ